METATANHIWLVGAGTKQSWQDRTLKHIASQDKNAVTIETLDRQTITANKTVLGGANIKCFSSFNTSIVCAVLDMVYGVWEEHVSPDRVKMLAACAEKTGLTEIKEKLEFSRLLHEILCLDNEDKDQHTQLLDTLKTLPISLQEGTLYKDLYTTMRKGIEEYEYEKEELRHWAEDSLIARVILGFRQGNYTTLHLAADKGFVLSLWLAGRRCLINREYSACYTNKDQHTKLGYLYHAADKGFIPAQKKHRQLYPKSSPWRHLAPTEGKEKAN